MIKSLCYLSHKTTLLIAFFNGGSGHFSFNAFFWYSYLCLGLYISYEKDAHLNMFVAPDLQLNPLQWIIVFPLLALLQLLAGSVHLGLYQLQHLLSWLLHTCMYLLYRCSPTSPSWDCGWKTSSSCQLLKQSFLFKFPTIVTNVLLHMQYFFFSTWLKGTHKYKAWNQKS